MIQPKLGMNEPTTKDAAANGTSPKARRISASGPVRTSAVFNTLHRRELTVSE